MIRKGNYESNKDMVFFVDPEDWANIPISRQEASAINRMQERMKKYINPDELRSGTIQIISTMAEDSNNDGFKNLWNLI